MRQDLQKLDISGDTEKQILAAALRAINKFLEEEGMAHLPISDIPVA